MQAALLQISIDQLYQLITQLPLEEQLNFAEQIKKRALVTKWQQFINTAPAIEIDISEEEIMAEVKAARADRQIL